MTLSVAATLGLRGAIAYEFAHPSRTTAYGSSLGGTGSGGGYGSTGLAGSGGRVSSPGYSSQPGPTAATAQAAPASSVLGPLTRKPMWLLAFYLVWQTLVIGTGISLKYWWTAG